MLDLLSPESYLRWQAQEGRRWCGRSYVPLGSNAGFDSQLGRTREDQLITPQTPSAIDGSLFSFGTQQNGVVNPYASRILHDDVDPKESLSSLGKSADLRLCLKCHSNLHLWWRREQNVCHFHASNTRLWPGVPYVTGGEGAWWEKGHKEVDPWLCAIRGRGTWSWLHDLDKLWCREMKCWNQTWVQR